MPPTLGLNRSQLQHRCDLARWVHADVGEDEQVELIVEDQLQMVVSGVASQREMAVSSQGREAACAGILGISQVVGENLVAGIGSDSLQPAQRPDRAIVVDEVR